MKRMIASASMLLVAALLGCSSTPAPRTGAKADTLQDEVNVAMLQFKNQDPSLQDFLNDSYAYAIFPNVTTGAVGVGGAYGKGEVFRNGKMIGYADLSQASIGAQLGGQTYSELLVFQNDAAFDQFRDGKLAFDARASAVAASRGAATAAAYQRGVAIFTNTQSGLMFQAAIGGQEFRFERSNNLATEQ